VVGRRLLKLGLKNNMLKKTKAPKAPKQVKKTLPREIIILQDVCQTLLASAFTMNDLIEELIHQRC